MTLVNFPKVWIGPGIPGVRDCRGTYCETPLQRMPLVEASDNLSWLEPLDPALDAEFRRRHPRAETGGSPYLIEARQVYSQNAKTILAQAKTLKLRLPEAFKELVQSADLNGRFLSPTACDFDLPEKIVSAPFGLDGHIIRFLNDQQCCVLWYLYLPAHGAPVVLAYYPVEGTEFLEELDMNDVRAVAEASDATRVVAHTFVEFLYRYWIESNVWFKKYYGIDLSSTEEAYIRRCT